MDHFGDHFYIRTNDQAKNFRLMKTPVDKTTMANWTEVIGHRDDVFLEGFEIFKDYLVVTERTDGLRHLRIMPWDGGDRALISTSASRPTWPGSTTTPSSTPRSCATATPR